MFYPNEDKVGVKTIKTFAERMKSESVSRALMVVQANLTPFAKQCLTEMQPKYNIEVVSHPFHTASHHMHHCCLAADSGCEYAACFFTSWNCSDRTETF